jgi:hypothetical protein
MRASVGDIIDRNEFRPEENMVENSEALRAGARDLVNRAADMSNGLLEREIARASMERGGRKASA